METLTLDLPTLYADHHVTEVRRILLEVSGVQDVYASSAFRLVEITFDPQKTNEEEFKTRLEEAGYAGDLEVPREVVMQPSERAAGDNGSFRHTSAFKATGHVMNFGRHVPYSGRPLWPCPSMGPLSATRAVEE